MSPPASRSEAHQVSDVAAAFGVDVTRLLSILPDGVRRFDLSGDPRESGGDANAVVWLAAGDPILVLVGMAVATHEAVVAEPMVTWHSQSPVVTVVRDARCRLDDDGLENWLEAEINSAKRSRQTTFRTCDRCSRDTPPEWMLDDGLCQTCSEQDGVVF